VDDETRHHLRELIASIERRAAPRSRPAGARDSRVAAPGGAADGAGIVAGHERRETAAGWCSYREVRRAAGALAGRQPLDALANFAPGMLSLLTPDEELDGVAPGDLLFLDIETTGLGGAGAMTFLVATARLEDDGAFVLRQYLALSPAEESALLVALVEDARLDCDPVLVTYNGRGFDAPMLDSRMTMHRQRGGFEALRHIDLLTVARTLYRGLLRSCRLADVESAVLGITRPGDEVPGAEVPAWYFRFLRSGDGRCLLPLIRHNEIDVVALGGLLARLGALAAGVERPAHGMEGLAVARLLGRRGRVAEAVALLEHAVGVLAPSHARDEALARLAAHRKRAGRRDLAAPLWAELAACPGYARVHAQVELAKYYEHERRDYAAAASVVADALAVVDARPGAAPGAGAEHRRAALAHRQSRVLRKASSREADAAVEPSPG